MAKGSIRNFFKRNKFLTCLLIALLCGGICLFAIPWAIAQRLDLIEIPISIESLPEGTLVTEDMLTTIEVSKAQMPHGIYVGKDAVVGKYVNAGCTIPANGFFYAELLASENNAYGAVYKELREGEFAYTIAVPTKYDTGDTITAGQYVNFYCYSTVLQADTINAAVSYDVTAFGQLAENVRVLSVSYADNSRYITVALTEEDLAYFTAAEQLGTVFPIVYYGSAQPAGITSQVYDMDLFRQWLDDKSLIYDIPTIFIDEPNEVIEDGTENNG